MKTLSYDATVNAILDDANWQHDGPVTEYVFTVRVMQTVAQAFVWGRENPTGDRIKIRVTPEQGAEALFRAGLISDE